MNRFDPGLVGARLQEIRRERKLTQVQVADSVGMSELQIKRIESGNRNVTCQALCDFMNVYAVNADDILSVCCISGTDKPGVVTRLKKLSLDKQLMAERIFSGILDELEKEVV